MKERSMKEEEILRESLTLFIFVRKALTSS
jgi:hypothetical protein